MTADTMPVGPAPGNGPSREYRASVAFAISGLFTLAVLVLYAGLLSTTPPVRGVVALSGVVLGMVAMLGTALGLGYGRPWAATVATPLLVLVVIGGLIEVVVALTHNSITLPLGAVLALWALRAPLRTLPDPATGTRRWGFAGAFVVIAMLLSTGWPVLSTILMSAGGPLIVDETALLPNLAVTCDGGPGVAPTAVHVTYDWRWSRTELMVAGSDTVTLSADSVRDDGQPIFDLDSTGPTSAGIWQSDVMTNHPVGVVFGIDLVQAGFEPGSVGMRLIRASEAPLAHGSVQVHAVYLHAPADTTGPNTTALWRSKSSARCEW